MTNLQLHLKPSRSFFIMMIFIIFGALLSIFCSFLPYYIQLILVAAVLLYGGRVIWAQVYMWSPKAIVAVACGEDNTWLLKERSGDSYRAQLCDDCTRWPGLSILRFKLQSSSFLGKEIKRGLVIFHDAVKPDEYRQMLMRLGTTKVY